MAKDSKLKLRVAGTVPESVVDGPGFRYVIFAQGCLFGCEGCHNLHAQDPKGGHEVSVDDIVAELEKAPLVTGVTFSGGEPFLQPKAFYAIAKAAKKIGLNVVIFTGHTWEELMDLAQKNANVKKLIEIAELIIDGRFVLSQRDLSLAFRGSRNQRIIDVPKTLESGEVRLWEAMV